MGKLLLLPLGVVGAPFFLVWKGFVALAHLGVALSYLGAWMIGCVAYVFGLDGDAVSARLRSHWLSASFTAVFGLVASPVGGVIFVGTLMAAVVWYGLLAAGSGLVGLVFECLGYDAYMALVWLMEPKERTQTFKTMLTVARQQRIWRKAGKLDSEGCYYG